MSVVNVGMDLVECSRIAGLLERHPERFLERVLTARERQTAAQFRDPAAHVAGRFAAKEAILKVLGTGWRGNIAWTDMEIVNDSAGKPEATLTAECARIARDRGIGRILLSITHTRDYAAATAVGLASE